MNSVTNLDLLYDLLAEWTHFSRTANGHVVIAFVLTGDAVEGAWIIGKWGAQVCPKFDQEESALWTFVIEFLQTFLLWELVVNLANVYRLEHWVIVRGRWLTNVHKKVLFLFILHESTELDETKLVGSNGTPFKCWSKTVAERSTIGSHKEGMCSCGG